MRKAIAVVGIAVSSLSAVSASATSVTIAAATPTQSSLYLVSTSESEATGATTREWFLSDGSRERQQVLASPASTPQLEEGQAFSIDTAGTYKIATLTLNFVTVGGGTNGLPLAKTWSLRTTEASCQAVCSDGGSGLFFGPRAIQFAINAHYAEVTRTAPCAVQGGCSQFRVIDRSARLRGQSVFELQETNPSGCSVTLTSHLNCTAFTDYWVTQGSDMMLETVHGNTESTKTTVQTYRWAKLTTTNCQDLAVTIPRGFTRLATTNQSDLVRNVWPKLDCSNLASL